MLFSARRGASILNSLNFCTNMQLLGYDLGSSSIKVCLLDAASGQAIATASSPARELTIEAPQPGWAEQDPEQWWEHLQEATKTVMQASRARPRDVAGIGLAYQMHGLVMVDQNQQAIHPAIIWCDGRAVEMGERALADLGRAYCLEHLCNAPGNFTASRLGWIRQNRPQIFARIHKVMLPGDYIAMKMTGEIRTSLSGLSEGIFWDYQSGGTAEALLDYYGIPARMLPDYDPNIAVSGTLTPSSASLLGLRPGIPIGYRAGDQPNNALSLNVTQPGEAAATAGTSGVIYGVTDRPVYDERSRVNTFIHATHRTETPRYGVLLCVNGTGIQYRWLKNHLMGGVASYEEMNRMAQIAPVGSDGVRVYPFGNGPERVLENRGPGAHIKNIQFNRHRQEHVVRAAQEGIAFSLAYGLQVMKAMGLEMKTIRVGNDNMFRSAVFREAFVHATGMVVERYESHGARGAAIGAGLGTGIFADREEAFQNIEKIATLQPDPVKKQAYGEAYSRWEEGLQQERQ